jgi:hypothetical protein
LRSFGSSLNFFSCKLFWLSTILTHDYHQFSAVFTSVQPANCFDYELLKSILSKLLQSTAQLTDIEVKGWWCRDQTE